MMEKEDSVSFHTIRPPFPRGRRSPSLATGFKPLGRDRVDRLRRAAVAVLPGREWFGRLSLDIFAFSLTGNARWTSVEWKETGSPALPECAGDAGDSTRVRIQFQPREREP